MVTTLPWQWIPTEQQKQWNLWNQTSVPPHNMDLWHMFVDIHGKETSEPMLSGYHELTSRPRTHLRRNSGHKLVVPGKEPWSSVSFAERNLTYHRVNTASWKPTQKMMEHSQMRCPFRQALSLQSNQASSRSWSGGEPQRRASERGW